MISSRKARCYSVHAFRRRAPYREEYDFFNNKPQQHRRGPTKETDLDRGDISKRKRITNYSCYAFS